MYAYILKRLLSTQCMQMILQWCPHESKIGKTSSEIKELDFYPMNEEYFDSLLGIQIDTDDDEHTTMSQPSLYNKIIQTLGLEGDSKKHLNIVVSPPFYKHEESDDFNDLLKC